MISYDVRSRQGEAVRRQSLEVENLRLRDALQEQFRPENIIGNSHPMREVYVKIKQVARQRHHGAHPRGVGHGQGAGGFGHSLRSRRAKNPLVKVNCAALNENLLESELFGHEKGAFTGALSARTGRIEEAEGGTLFLDEIGDFSPAIQVKLLRVLQEREYERVGSSHTLKADVRIIAATNQDLEARLSEGLFRQDLYYRINVFPISPAAAPRPEGRYSAAGRSFRGQVCQENRQRRAADQHPGDQHDVRLSLAGQRPRTGKLHRIRRALGLRGRDPRPLSPAHAANAGAGESARQGWLKARVELLERDMIVDALKSTQGRVSMVAEVLGITPRMVRYKMKNLSIDPRRLCEACWRADNAFRRRPRVRQFFPATQVKASPAVISPG